MRAPLFAASLLLGACGTEPSQPVETSSALPPGIVARVGAEEVSADAVARVAKERGLAPRAALALLVRDALFAQAVREDPSARALVSVGERGALARVVLEDLAARAAMEGPPTEAEIQTVRERRWYDIDRPEATRTIHVVALAKDAALRQKARALAERLRSAVAGVTTADDFEAKAKAVPAGDIEVRVERLDPVAKDGRVVPARPPIPGEPVARLDLPFAEAASALPAPEAQSEVVETSHGFHVIMMLERVPAHRVPAEVAEPLLRKEALTDRARAAELALERSLINSAPVGIDRAAEQLTSLVSVVP
ncbi:MAG: hypothetical protein R3B13_33225 [Polyangiaceae bacterium]